MTQPGESMTIGHLIDYLAPRIERNDLVAWPPDAFAVAASILQVTGAYLRITADWPPQVPEDLAGIWWNIEDETPSSTPLPPEAWPWLMSFVGHEWAEHVAVLGRNPAQEEPLPPILRRSIQRWFKTVFENRHLSLAGLRQNWTDPVHLSVIDALLQICAAADESCVGIGLISPDEVGCLIDLGNNTLRKSKPATLCRGVRPEACLVLPKLHTPQCGATIRSLSHHLALCRGSEVVPQWLFAASEFRRETPPSSNVDSDSRGLNLLVIPWPAKVVPRSFQPSRRTPAGSIHGYFTYAPQESIDPASEDLIAERERRLIAIYDAAISSMGRIDGIVMPELALDHREIGPLARAFLDRNKYGFFVAGVRTPPTGGAPGKNEACLAFKIGDSHHFVHQAKHHRWCLEKMQIEAYGLGGMLSPTMRWWEDIGIERRELTFMPFSPDLTAAVLICEDLARQEPISDVIRTVGPNLVIALLMDGPQLAGRWPGRYATVLADDPGCSVLSVTSIGMTELSRPAGQVALRTIGLWKDPLNGVRQINLEAGSEAVVLSLTHDMHTERTLDGREDNGVANFLALNGVHSIRMADVKSAALTRPT